MKQIKDNKHLSIKYTAWDGGAGIIRLPRNNKTGFTKATIIWSWGMDWEHVSVSPLNGTMPTWDDMCFIKDMFWNEAEVLEIQDIGGNALNDTVAYSQRDSTFEYKVGETVERKYCRKSRLTKTGGMSAVAEYTSLLTDEPRLSIERGNRMSRYYKAEVVPKAKEGEWINKGEYAECSLCGAHSGTQYDGVEPIPLKTMYCPDCGAKMKGADNE